MYTEFDYFIVDKENFKGKKTFPFQLYIFNTHHKKFSLILNGNRPLTKEVEEFIDFALNQGGQLAVLRKQKKTFLQAQELNESDIPSLQKRELHELEKEQMRNTEIMAQHLSTYGVFSFQQEFEKAILSDDFSFIIESARVEIMTFSVCRSPTVSFAIHLAKEYLTLDNFTNRIVAFSYFSAKTMNLIDQSTLSDIVVACFLLHLGHTQLPLRSSRTAYFSLGEKDQKIYKKHTILANHLIRRGGLDISEQCKKIILDHHEKPTGHGYPSEKLSENLDISTLLVGAVSHIFEFSTGKITGNKQPLRSIIINLQNKNFIPGLEFDFGDKIFDIIVNIINSDNTDQKKSA